MEFIYLDQVLQTSEREVAVRNKEIGATSGGP